MYSNYYGIPNATELHFGYTPSYSLAGTGSNMGPMTEVRFLAFDNINFKYVMVSENDINIRERRINDTCISPVPPFKYKKISKYTFTKGTSYPVFDCNLQRSTRWADDNCISRMFLEDRTKRPSMFNPTNIMDPKHTSRKIMANVKQHIESVKKKSDVEMEYGPYGLYDGYEESYADYHRSRSVIKYVKSDDDFEYCI